MSSRRDAVRVTPPRVRGLVVGAAPDGPPCVLFAGRLVAAKGVRDAVEIWQRAAVGLPLVVAGAGPERGTLPPLDGLELPGWVPHHELPGLFARARGLLLPSRLLEARAAGDERAGLAVRIFCRTIRKQVGAYAAALGGLDTLVFTGGIGEHAADVRDEICACL